MTRPANTSPHTRAVLQALLRSFPTPAYGYDLSRETGLKSGTLYPILQRLHKQAHLGAAWEESPHAGRPPRHIYTLTEQGLELARERQESPAPSLTGALI